MTTAIMSSAELTAEYINPVITATKSVFETMLGCTPKRTGLHLKDAKAAPYAISAVIGISGRAAGTIVVSMTEQAAIAVLDRFLDIQADEINTEVCDAVGELTNMIAGAAKAQLERYELSISIPNIVSGPNHNIHYTSEVKPICIVYESEIGSFSIEVGFSNLK